MEVLIIGAGAAGLMAARELLRHGVEVTLLEARDRIGGRIHTLMPGGFSFPVEAAAEFIHVENGLTSALMREAGIDALPAEGIYYYRSGNGLKEGFGESRDWDAFHDAMLSLTEDMTVAALLAAHFPREQYPKLHKEVHDMAQGLDLADLAELSVFCIRDEWASEAPQFRPSGGYGPLLEWLLGTCRGPGFRLLPGHKVHRVEWHRGAVTAVTQHGTFTADRVILTLPVPALRQNAVAIVPDIGISAMAEQLGWGEVIKIALEFDALFWEKEYPDLGFLFTGEGFTFWTQLSVHSPLLTGWIGNDHAPAYGALPDAELVDKSLSELQELFPQHNVRAGCRASAVFRHTAGSVTGGGYSWLKPESYAVLEKVSEGFEGTLFFAGEAWHPEHTATVEGALQSGRDVARKILAMQAS